MARSFTRQEKETIKKNLMEICKKSWTQYGYKKTSVDDICKKAGISKGAFYIFFKSKEALFCEVLCSVQEQICNTAANIIEENKNKYGVAEALKFIYQEYDKNNFLYNSDSTDFTILMNRLPDEQVKRIKNATYMGRQLFLDKPYLKLKIDTDMAVSVIYSLIMNIKSKNILPHSHMETFDFMVDHLIDSLYEQQAAELTEAENENRSYNEK